ncbi:hypothetical protein ACEPAH_9404 [Sanghuangporus vaninii]
MEPSATFMILARRFVWQSLLLNKNGVLSWEDVAKKLLSWYEDGYLSSVGYCFDIDMQVVSCPFFSISRQPIQLKISNFAGNVAREALAVYSNTLQRGAKFTLAGSSNPLSLGNGSLVCLAPVSVFYYNNPMKALAMSDLQSKITHTSWMCIESCGLATAQLLGLFAGTESSSIEERKKQFLNPLRIFVNQIKSSSFVIHSHEAALWALWNSMTFEEGMLLLLPLESDVDTVCACAIYGQLAGALHGIESIPDKWLNTLQREDILKKTFDTLVGKALLSSTK